MNIFQISCEQARAISPLYPPLHKQLAQLNSQYLTLRDNDLLLSVYCIQGLYIQKPPSPDAETVFPVGTTPLSRIWYGKSTYFAATNHTLNVSADTS